MGLTSLCVLANVFAMFSLTMASEHRSSAPVQHYVQYHNEKYNYRIDYPADFKSTGESDAGDGIFLDSQRELKMSVWGTFSNWMNGSDMSLREQFNWTKSNLATDKALPNAKVTYQRLAPHSFVLSGNSKDKIFYMRTVASDHAFATVQLVYPKTLKRNLDAEITHIANSLKAGPVLMWQN